MIGGGATWIPVVGVLDAPPDPPLVVGGWVVGVVREGEAELPPRPKFVGLVAPPDPVPDPAAGGCVSAPFPAAGPPPGWPVAGPTAVPLLGASPGARVPARPFDCGRPLRCTYTMRGAAGTTMGCGASTPTTVDRSAFAFASAWSRVASAPVVTTVAAIALDDANTLLAVAVRLRLVMFALRSESVPMNLRSTSARDAQRCSNQT